MKWNWISHHTSRSEAEWCVWYLILMSKRCDESIIQRSHTAYSWISVFLSHCNLHTASWVINIIHLAVCDFWRDKKSCLLAALYKKNCNVQSYPLFTEHTSHRAPRYYQECLHNNCRPRKTSFQGTIQASERFKNIFYYSK